MEKMDGRRELRRHSKLRLIIALLFIVVGCISIAYNTGYISEDLYSILLSWQMLFIIVGLLAVLQRHYTGGLVMICVGAYLLIPKFSLAGQQWVDTYWPLVFVFAGIIILIRIFTTRSWNNRHNCSNEFSEKMVYETENGYIVSDNSFGQVKHLVIDPVFKGARIKNSFGGTILDLRRTALEEGDTFIDIECSFGGIEIFAPTEWTVINNIRPVFGGVDDKRFYPADNSNHSKRLILRGTISFSGVEIK